MHGLIAAALDRSRTSLLLLAFLMLGGLAAYIAMPKESNPDVAIPIIYVSVSLEGISPEDAERLLVRPLEQELRSLEGVKEMRAMASEGHASVTLEFDAGFDAKQALADVREKVDTARSKLPEEADEPTVNEVNVALFPVLSVGLSGPIAETELVYIARRLKERIEGIPEVLSVEIGGDREDLLEIVVDPQVLDSYGIDYNTLFTLVSRNNRLVAAGSLDNGAGRLSMKVPGVIENLDDVHVVEVFDDPRHLHAQSPGAVIQAAGGNQPVVAADQGEQRVVVDAVAVQYLRVDDDLQQVFAVAADLHREHLGDALDALLQAPGDVHQLGFRDGPGEAHREHREQRHVDLVDRRFVGFLGQLAARRIDLLADIGEGLLGVEAGIELQGHRGMSLAGHGAHFLDPLQAAQLLLQRPYQQALGIFRADAFQAHRDIDDGDRHVRVGFLGHGDIGGQAAEHEKRQ